MQKEIDALLEKIPLDSEQIRKYFFIFDIDGTLRPDTIDGLDHRHPKIPPQTALQLKDINLEPNCEVVILTARSYADMFKSNFPKDITKYCGCGKQILDNEILRYPRDEFQRSYDETVIFIDILKDILGKALVSKIDFLVAPGDFAIYFNEASFEKSKEEIMEKVNLILENSSRWEFTDHGKELIFIDNKYHYDKGDAVKDIMDNLDLSLPTYVFMFGDSPSDARAMLGLRDYQKDHPHKRLKVANVSVGDSLGDYGSVDFRFESHLDTIGFIEALHGKIFGQK